MEERLLNFEEIVNGNMCQRSGNTSLPDDEDIEIFEEEILEALSELED
ncbi:hypothetical protein AAFB50_001975 [Enterococcus faecalis]